MYKLLQKTKNLNTFSYLYFATILFTFHSYLMTYINSSFLNQFVNKDEIGLIYIVGSIFNLIIFLQISKILQNYGNYKMMTWATILEIFLLFTIATSHNVFWVILSFILHVAVSPFILLGIDNILESSSKDDDTGEVRGIFLTIGNLTAVVAPVIVGSILTESGFPTLYFLAMLFLLPFIYIVVKKLRKLKDNNYHNFHLPGNIKAFSEDKNIRNIYFANLLLNIFYAWAVIYAPIYLHEQMNFTWQQIGLMISIALIPFVLLEIPVGSLADKKIGEKEILVSGFIISSIGLFAMTYTNATSFIVWTIILIITRVGASLIEISTESYFFKQIHAQNQNLISTFRTATPIGYILGSLLGSLCLLLMNEKYIFAVLGVVMLIGIKNALAIKDSK